MSTRATIARQTEGDAFIGRYIHFDGYPSGVGIGILRALNRFGLTEGKKVLLDDHPAGWSNVASCDWTQEIGSIESMDDPNRPMCYCHGDEVEEEWLVDSAGDDGGAQWAYVFSNSINSLMVYEHKYDDKIYWQLQSEIDLTNLSDAMSAMMEVCPYAGVSA
jgi:hypothetical protein